MKKKATEHNRFILGQTPLEAILAFRNCNGLTTRELWQSGRLGNHPGEYLMTITSELFPIKASDIAKIHNRNRLVSRAMEELKKLRALPSR